MALAGVAVKKAKKKVKKASAATEQQKQQRAQKNSIRGLFLRLGFSRISADGIEFEFDGRTGEFDDAYIYQNVLIMAEYTVAQDVSAHVAKKSILYQKIKKDEASWVDKCAEIYPEFAAQKKVDGFNSEHYRVFICYFSRAGVGEQYEDSIGSAKFLDGTKFRYFQALSKAIHGSARYELFSYLGLSSAEVGKNVFSTSSPNVTYKGHVLPEGFSSFPKGFKVASFYAAPGDLLRMAYVLRRDSWRDPEGMYQRVIQKGRMGQMRRYLTTEERVFVNNIIVTLPSETSLNDPSKSAKNLNENELKTVRPVTVSIPDRPNVVGIVDGQHRVFCYHEGTDSHEAKIKLLRDRQNLLVTGLIYPDEYSDEQKRRFEAKLFLEINDKQKRTGSELKQSIEVILNPYSTISIAKAVIVRLNAAGALKGMLQTNYFDSSELIKTTSIVSYGLRPIVKLEGDDSLFSAWNRSDKKVLKEIQRSKESTVTGDMVLSAYIEYAARRINTFLIAAKKLDGKDRWRLHSSPKDRTLTPTVINGFIVCLRLLIKDGKSFSELEYADYLKAMPDFTFTKYRSSSWRKMGEDMYNKFFAE